MLKHLLVGLSVALVVYCTVDTINTSVLKKILTYSACHTNCEGDLPDLILDLLEFEDTYEKIMTICQKIKGVSECLQEKKCGFANRFVMIYGGFYDLCTSKKFNYITAYDQCLQDNLDQALQDADNHCEFTQEIERFSHDPIVISNAGKGGATFIPLISRTGPLCTSTICFLPNFQQTLDAVCPVAGSVMTAAMMRPFYHGLNFVNNLGSAVGSTIKRSVPPQCYPLGNKTFLNMVRKPRQQY
ncbi:unnamed protein product [Bursaphelenchus okinawaensis]|uniref:CPG4 domain-containing protein n=1 Tax=Bursaphelenchus okinawaensis TaxID=465554 RepID=A0A811JUV2_9BILA|nr:unnamed protein product [Bursaphelenchus okinawaensis]CAG9084691.1 unnamed protein product [Bursaphelenchus okinawaensis]